MSTGNLRSGKGPQEIARLFLPESQSSSAKAGVPSPAGGEANSPGLGTGLPRPAWTVQQRAGLIGSLVATDGGLFFGRDVVRRFMAFDDETGEFLWKTIVSGPVSGRGGSTR